MIDWRPRWFVLLACAAAWARSGSAGLAPAQKGAPASQAAEAAARASVRLADIPGVALPASAPVESHLDDAPQVKELYDAALKAFEAREIPRAVARLDAAIDAAGEDYYELHYLLALAKYRLGRFGEARLSAQKAAEIRPAAADVRYLLGKLFARQGQDERAIEQFRTATSAADRELGNVRVTLSWYELGRLLESTGHTWAAAEAYAQFDSAVWEVSPEHRTNDEVAEILTRHPDGMLEVRVALLEKLGRASEALAAAEWGTRNRPRNPTLARAYVAALIHAGRADAALAEARSRMTDPATRSGYVRLAVEAALRGRLVERWLADLRADVPAADRGGYVAEVATALQARGEYVAAVRLWRELAAESADDVEVGSRLAAALRDAGELREAVSTLAALVRRGDGPSRMIDLDGWMTRYDDVDRFLAIVPEIESDPQCDFATRFVLGGLAAAARQSTLSQRLFQACLEQRPDFALAHVAWGRLLLQEFRWPEAVEHATAALAISAELGAAHWVLAEAQSGLDENDAAERSFKAAMRLSPRDRACAIGMARHAHRLGDVLAAQRYFQQAAMLDPTDAEAVDGVIESYISSGKVEIAQAQLRRAEEAGLEPQALRRNRLMIEFASTPFSAAHVAALQEHVTAYPEDVVSVLRLGAALYVHRRDEEALELAQRAVRLAPEDSRALSLLARVLVRRLDYGRAAAIIEALVARYPNRVAMLSALAEVYLYDFRAADARAMYERALERAGDEPTRRAMRAKLLECHRVTRDWEGALRRVDEWERAGVEEDALATRAQILLDAERYEEVLALVEKWLDESPGDWGRRAAYQLCAMRGRAYDKLAARIQAWTERKAEAAPTDPSVDYALLLGQWQADVLIALKRPDDALAALNRLRTADPGSEMAMRLLRTRCDAAAGRVDQALAELKALREETARAGLRGGSEEVRRRIISTLAEAKRYDDALKACDEWLAESGPDDLAERFTVNEYRRGVLQAAGWHEKYVATMEAQLDVVERLVKLAEDGGRPATVDALRRERAGLANDLGYTWVDRGENMQRATALIRQAVAENPLNPAFLDSLGWALYKAGDYVGACKHLERSLQLIGGRDATVYDHLGDAEYRRADAAAARRAWEEALRVMEEQQVHGDHPDAELLSAVRNKLDALKSGAVPDVAAISGAAP